MDHHPPITQALHSLLERRSDLRAALIAAIERANLPDDFKDLDGFYHYISRAVKQIPNNTHQMMQQDLAYYYVLSISKNQILIKDPEFQAWNHSFNDAWGEFLNSAESLGHVEKYLDDPSFEMGDYLEGPGGWRSFNQFFARQVKPGRRPVSGLCDSKVVVSPCDGEVLEIGHNTPETKISSKGTTFPIAELLEGSPYAEDFKGGVYWSILLQIFNYHRFHSPVSGSVLESRIIPGVVGLTIEEVGGQLTPVPKPGFQATQQRGLLVFENDLLGKVAMVPVGMAQISSIALTAEVGAKLNKGDECGYFQFGGSNIIMLTQEGAFDPAKKSGQSAGAAPSGLMFNQGERIGSGYKPGSL